MVKTTRAEQGAAEGEMIAVFRDLKGFCVEDSMSLF